MATIIGVRFRNAGKIYYFNPNGFQLRVGDHVIVETSRGTEIGLVTIAPREVSDESIKIPTKDVVRIATEEDVEKVNANIAKEKEAYRICQEKIREHELDMKLVQAEYAFDNSKLLFYFTAEGRVDFRDLVKDLAAIFHTRIELRQIGVRDETKMLGGIASCGRELCCTSFLNDFAPVSIKMAKEQNLSLNPTKISGVCGRLMCCLKNEEDTYEYLNARMPKVGDRVQLKDGKRGEVYSINILRQQAKILIEENDTKEIVDSAVEDLKFRPRNKQIELTEEEMALYENLENEQAEIKRVRREMANQKREKKETPSAEEKPSARSRANKKNKFEQAAASKQELETAVEEKTEQKNPQENNSSEKPKHKKNRNRNRNKNKNKQNNQNNQGPKEGN